MKLEEFVQRPDDEECYDHPDTVPSPVGAFGLGFQVFDGDPPDARMLELLEELVARFKADADRVVAMIHEEYEEAVADAAWADFCEVPTGLSVEQLEPHLENRSLYVRRDSRDEEEPLAARLYVSPDWDQEHGYYLAHEDGRWMREDC